MMATITVDSAPKTNHGKVDVRQPSNRKRKKRGDGHWLRVSRACTHCRKLKIRCEEQRPCRNCEKFGHVCGTESPERQPAAASPSIPGSQRQKDLTWSIYDSISSVEKSSVEAPQPGVAVLVDNVVPDYNRKLASKALSTGSRDSNHTQASASSVLPIINESLEKRWGGESSYAASSELLSNIEPLLKVSYSNIGLPGTDDQPRPKRDKTPDTYLEPSSCGFPDQEKIYLYLDGFFNSVHCIFSFVHERLCRQFFDELYTNGAEGIDPANRGAHLAILALGCQSQLLDHVTEEATTPIDSSASEKLYETARALGVSSVEKPSIPAIALLVALSLYQLATGRYTAAWTTFGTCVRQAQAIGLHRETPSWGISKLLREARRSTWINIYTLDTFFSMCYGRPPAISNEHCDVLPPSVYLDDHNNVLLQYDPETTKGLSIVQICEATPTRMQFHLLKFHLCQIIRKLLGPLYLSPTTSSNSMTIRQKWDILQRVIEDLYELCACIPNHLRVADIDGRVDKTHLQQAMFLDILINYTIILAYRPIIKLLDTETIPKEVASSRSNTSKEASYAAAYGICTMVRYGRDKKLGLSVQLILSAWGVYTSAAELIALHAIQSPAGSQEAREAYQSLSAILRHFSSLKRSWPCNGANHAILQGLVQVVRQKVIVESRATSPVPTVQNQGTDREHTEDDQLVHATSGPRERSTPQNTNGSIPNGVKAATTSFDVNDLGLHWFDKFLASGKDGGGVDQATDEQHLDLNDFDFCSWGFPID